VQGALMRLLEGREPRCQGNRTLAQLLERPAKGVHAAFDEGEAAGGMGQAAAPPAARCRCRR
jgi:hypothetical protein